MKEIIIGACIIGISIALMVFYTWLEEQDWHYYLIIGVAFIVISYIMGSITLKILGGV